MNRSPLSYFGEQVASYRGQSKKGFWNWWKQREFRAVQRHMLPLDGLSVLEVGCGTGWYSVQLRRSQPRPYIATDYLWEMVRAVPDEGFLRVAADLNRLPFAGDFDAILCAGALEFVDSPAAFFAECQRLLKPDGKVVVLLPPNNVWGRLYRAWHRRHQFDIHLFDRPQLEQLASVAGLKLTRLSQPALYTLVVTFQKVVQATTNG